MKHSEDKKRIASARLRAAGIPLPVEDRAVIKPDLLVECLKGSRAFGLKMGSEFVFNVRISNDSYGILKIDKLRGHFLEADWELIFQTDPREHVPERKTYRTLSGRRLRYDSVLNHRLGREIAPGTSIRGKLLASSVTMNIPEDYSHGQSVPLEIVITDQYGRQHASIIEVPVDRSATMPKRQAYQRTEGGLYGGCPVETPKFDTRVPLQVPAAKGNFGEKAEELPEVMKQVARLLKMDDVALDAMQAELEKMQGWVESQD